MEKSNTGKKDTQGNCYYYINIYNRQSEQFDWYQTYSGVKDIITQYMTKTDHILNIGCGNSSKYNYINVYTLYRIK